MSSWTWAIVGAGAFLLLSGVIGLGLAATLGRISREVSDLLEPELWASAPLTREEIQDEEEAPAERTPSSERVGAQTFDH
jgi:hypothetical protein